MGVRHDQPDILSGLELARLMCVTRSGAPCHTFDRTVNPSEGLQGTPVDQTCRARVTLRR
jgi:hypothetical protein